MSEAWNPEAYEEDLAQGLSLSGENSTYFAEERVRQVKAFSEYIDVQPRSVLEFGCGTGNNLEFLARAFPTARLVGLERSEAMLGAARARFAGRKVEFVDDRAFAEEGTIDLIFINGVFHHIEPADRPAAFTAVRRYLAKDGLLALFDNNPLNPGAMWVMKRIPFDRDAKPVLAWTLGKMARQAGLSATTVRTYFYFPGPLRFLRGLEPMLQRVPLGAQYALFARG
ncbi:MAG: class I SAM-dependent methyltransferase [Salinibacterium sp.]|nr:class I SAM-dependent methyltransferase [Salinibacterium sp.]